MQSRLSARRLLAGPAMLAVVAGGLVTSGVAGAAAPAAAAPATCSPRPLLPLGLAKGPHALSRPGGITGAFSMPRCGGTAGGMSRAAGGTRAASQLADNPSSIFTSVRAVSASDVWAVGSHLTSSGASVALIEHWDGSSWTVTPSPTPGAASELTSVTGRSATDAWAVGFTEDSSGNVTSLIEHWDGTSSLNRILKINYE